jgi:hypothetical protein
MRARMKAAPSFSGLLLMRAETFSMIDEIRSAVALIRRHL